MLQYERMAAAIDRLLNGGSAALSEAAGATCLSPFYFQRQFRRFVGVSPHRFTAALKLNDIKARLKKGDDILTATWDAGLSGGGRAHDLFITHEAVTPGEFRRRGKNISITHGVSATPFGKVFIASTARGVCLLRFIDTTTHLRRCLMNYTAYGLRQKQKKITKPPMPWRGVCLAALRQKRLCMLSAPIFR